MIVLGDVAAAKCSIRNTPQGPQFSGPTRGFAGYKTESASGKDGIFVEWSFDDGVLNLRNDRLGFFPLFFTQSPEGFAFSPRIFDLIRLAPNADLDEDAIAVFLRSGAYVGNSTAFKHIKVLPPGARLRYEAGRLTIECDGFPKVAHSTLSRDDALNAYGESFQTAIEKFRNVADRRFALPLSGGRDSRHILFGLVHAGLKPHLCITMKHQAPKPDEDAEVAKLVCAAVGADHLVLDQPASMLSAERRKNTETNLNSLEHSWILPLADYLVEHEYDAIFDGIGGGILSNGAELTPKRIELYRRGKIEELADDLLIHEGYLPKMLTKSAYARFSRSKALELMSAELKLHAGAANPLGQFLLFNRVRRHIAQSSWGILSKRCHVFGPFLEEGVCNFLSSLPAEYFVDHDFHEIAINRFHPEYAAVPYETKDAPLKSSNHMINCYQLLEYTAYFLRSFSSKSLLSPGFLYPRVAKGVLSPQFSNGSRDMYKVPVYLTELISAAAANQNRPGNLRLISASTHSLLQLILAAGTNEFSGLVLGGC